MSSPEELVFDLEMADDQTDAPADDDDTPMVAPSER